MANAEPSTKRSGARDFVTSQPPQEEETTRTTSKRTSGRRSRDVRDLIESHLASDQETLSVGKANVQTEPVEPGVAAVRYGTLIFCMASLTLATSLRLGWSLPLGLTLFAVLSIVGVVALSLIETRQITSVLNSWLDYLLNRRRMEGQLSLLERLLEATLRLDDTELRQRLNLERQKFILDNSVRIFELVNRREGGSTQAATKALVSMVVPDGSPGAFIDTIIEENIITSMTAFAVTLYDHDERNRMVRINGKTGLILDGVPWDISNEAMNDEERDIAYGILKRIASRARPLFQEKNNAWYLNIKDYPTPMTAISAFDIAYGE